MSFDKLFHNYLHFCVVFGVCQVCGCCADTNLGLKIFNFQSDFLYNKCFGWELCCIKYPIRIIAYDFLDCKGQFPALHWGKLSFDMLNGMGV